MSLFTKQEFETFEKMDDLLMRLSDRLEKYQETLPKRLRPYCEAITDYNFYSSQESGITLYFLVFYSMDGYEPATTGNDLVFSEDEIFDLNTEDDFFELVIQKIGINKTEIETGKNQFDATYLKNLQSIYNGGRGITCVRTIASYLEQNNFEDAQNVAFNDFDKLYQYPSVAIFVWNLFPKVQEVFSRPS